jgi:hypothetical protein
VGNSRDLRDQKLNSGKHALNGEILGKYGDTGYRKKYRVTETKIFSKVDAGKSNDMGINMERDLRQPCMESELRQPCMESERGNAPEGRRESPKTVVKLHERGLGHVTEKINGEATGQGESSRSPSCYMGPLFSEVERTLQEKGLGKKGEGEAQIKSPGKNLSYGKKRGRGEIDTQAKLSQLLEGNVTRRSFPEDEKTKGPVTKGRKLNVIAGKNNGSGMAAAAVQPRRPQ